MIHELMTREQVREQGAAAFRRGLNANDNPHWPPGTDAHLEWHAGFKGEQYGVCARGYTNEIKRAKSSSEAFLEISASSSRRT